jgi:hypothetical protein
MRLFFIAAQLELRGENIAFRPASGTALHIAEFNQD